MKIAILSDTHNQTDHLYTALARLQDYAVDTIIHCGDLTDAATLSLLEGYKVLLVLGNSDMYPGEIRRKIEQMGNGSLFGISLEVVLDGKRIFVTHGHIAHQMKNAQKSGLFDYIFTGHTHTFSDTKIGNTRMINPGSLGGTYRESRGFVVLDLATDKLERIQIT